MISAAGGSSTQTVTLTRRPDDGGGKRVKRKIATPRNLAALACAVLAAVYVAVAAVIRVSDQVQSQLIYLNLLTMTFSNLSQPAEFGLRNTRNLHLVQYDGCPVGVWHVLPDTYPDNLNSDQDYISALSDGATVVLYLHGNTATRGRYHRVQTYLSLAKRGYHVIAFDYRGFGESGCAPSERGMMEDALLVWDWVQSHAPRAPVFIWGHSLGSAAATYLAQELWQRRASHPRGVILDAPLPSMVEAAAHHPFGLPYWPVMPLFRHLVLESFRERFESESRLPLIPFPLLIAHGHSDSVIPFHLGWQMYQTALEARTRNPLLSPRLHFIDCGASGHKSNFESLDLHRALDHFVDGKL
jgi:abhydrolase domain-containing protein 12